MAEPGRLPELIAAAGPSRLGPRAGRTVLRLRHDLPEAPPDELRARVVARGERTVAAEGAFVGGPFLVLVPFAFCAALLSQARTILELAALEGRDPADPERGAELLFLQGVYEDVDAARAALSSPDRADGNGGSGGSGGDDRGQGRDEDRDEDRGDDRDEDREGDRKGGRRRKRRPGRIAALWDLSLRMARLLGVLTPTNEDAGLLARIGGWALSAAVFLTGLVAPLVWLPYLAFTYRRNTARLLDRATVFYAGAPAPRAPGRVVPAVLLALTRALVSLLVPAAAVAAVLLTDLRIAGGRWPVLGIALCTTSVLVGGWWVGRRLRSRRG
ncbi:hypothetical protein [Streptomyces roseoviridis]|uniref:Uncharacterized protein n=1 Tax=Streptomyces roseoviridis TaxID=67361 RepID=A0ABV5QX85_9ACTN